MKNRYVIFLALVFLILVAGAASTQNQQVVYTGALPVTTTLPTNCSNGMNWNGTIFSCAAASGGLPTGMVAFIASGTCPSGWTEMANSGRGILLTVAANLDVGATGGSNSYTPAGSNAAPALTMNSYTPAGSNAAPALTMNSYTPAGSNAAPALTMNAYTPAGTNSAPTFTGTAQTFTAVTFGNAGSGSFDGPNPYTPAGTVSAPTFTGTSATLTGSVAAPAFTGTAATLTGSVAAPAFTGSAATLTGSVAAPAFTGTSATIQPLYVKLIGCTKN